MPKPKNFSELMAHDKRYKREAYGFVFEALKYAHDVLEMGTAAPSEAVEESTAAEESAEPETTEGDAGSENRRHLTGRELCEAIRRYAVDQFGYMAWTVLQSWGVRTTGDFGNIVFNLIAIGEMSKTKEDRREDFEDVFDLESGLREEFRIEVPKAMS